MAKELNEEEERKYIEKEEKDVEIEDFEFEMLQDLAETILVFTSYIDNKLNENFLYILIGSGIESL